MSSSFMTATGKGTYFPCSFGPDRCTGIRKPIYKRWTAPTVSAKPNRYSSSGLSPRVASRNGCWSVQLRSSGSISWSSNKVGNKCRKVKPIPLFAETGIDPLCVAADKDELLEMITHGAEKIVNSNEE
jgi:hypothetical protein